MHARTEQSRASLIVGGPFLGHMVPIVVELSGRIPKCEQTHASLLFPSSLPHIFESLDSDPITRTESTVTQAGADPGDS